MKTIITWLLTALFLFLAVYFYWEKNEAESRLAIADNKLAETNQKLDQTQETADSLADMSLPPDTMELVPPGGVNFVDQLGSLSESDIRRLQDKGLQNPESDLLNDLNRKQRRLLPSEGTMGGTMTIRDSRILNDRYALAYFEDGHTGGYMVLRYEVSNGNISWRVIDSSRL